jgi:hypothetical protein
MMKVALFVTLAALCAYGAWRWLLRDVSEETIAAPQVMGGSLVVRKETCRRYYFGSGHWGYGGGDRRVTLRFELDGRELAWRGKPAEEPRVLQRAEEAVFLFYRHGTGGWEAVDQREFPAKLAVCNLSTEGQAWRNADDEARRDLIADHDEQRVQKLLDELFDGR